jgi:hypothetical protein
VDFYSGVDRGVGLFGSSKKATIQKLTNQTVGGQSVLYRYFQNSLGYEDKSIRLLELTYFASCVMTWAYLTVGKDKNRDEILDQYTRNVLEKSIPHSQEIIPMNTIIKEYRERYVEYGPLIGALFAEPDASKSTSPEILLLLHLCQSATGSNYENPTLPSMLSSSFLTTFVSDHIDLVQQL